jgi:hypothetical protein
MNEDTLKSMDELDAEASALNYVIQVDTSNYRLNTGQRKAIREMMVQMLLQTRIKLSMVVEDPALIKVRCELRSPVTGKRELHPPRETTDESE